MRKLRRVGQGEDDPLDGVANFFDLGVIFALGFMVPLMAKLTPSQTRADDGPATQANAAPARDANADPVKVDRYRPSTDALSGEGTRLGVAYRLKSGEVVYVPDGGGGAGKR